MLLTTSRTMARAVLFACTVTFAMTGCSTSNTPSAPAAPVAARIVNMTSAVQLVGPVASTVPGVSVQVLDANGAPVGGVTVTWTAFDGGSVSNATATTNGQGMATVAWTFGTIAEADSLQASVGTDLSTYIVGTAQAGPVTQLVVVSGDQQTIAEGASASLVVKAVDQYGNAVSGVAIAWTDQGGGLLSSATTLTDDTGQATVMLTADLSPEQYVVVAQASTATVTFVDYSN